METKLFVVHDDSTEIFISASKYQSADATFAEKQILEFAGLGEGTGYKIQVTDLTSGETQRDRFKWNYGRTMRLAHTFLEKNFDTCKSGTVIDVRVLLAKQIEVDNNYYLTQN